MHTQAETVHLIKYGNRVANASRKTHAHMIVCYVPRQRLNIFKINKNKNQTQRCKRPLQPHLGSKAQHKRQRSYDVDAASKKEKSPLSSRQQ
jgi:hypothetical protein